MHTTLALIVKHTHCHLFERLIAAGSQRRPRVGVVPPRASALLTTNHVVFTAFLLILLCDRPHHAAVVADVNARRGMRCFRCLLDRPVRSEFTASSKELNPVAFPLCNLPQPFLADAKPRRFLERPTGFVETLQRAHQRTQLRRTDGNATVVDPQRRIRGIQTPRDFGPEVAAMKCDRPASRQDGDGMRSFVTKTGSRIVLRGKKLPDRQLDVGPLCA